MNYLKSIAVFMIFTCLIMTSHSVLAALVHCPESIKTSQSLVEKIEGWASFLDKDNNAHYFNQVTFYSGHPNEHASLAPDNEHVKSNKLTWSFGKDKIWLACGYSNTNIQLIQKLPDTIKKCTVSYQSDFSKVTAINCM